MTVVLRGPAMEVLLVGPLEFESGALRVDRLWQALAGRPPVGALADQLLREQEALAELHPAAVLTLDTDVKALRLPVDALADVLVGARVMIRRGPLLHVRVRGDGLFSAAQLLPLLAFGMFDDLVDLHGAAQPDAILVKGYIKLWVRHGRRALRRLAIDVDEPVPILRYGRLPSDGPGLRPPNGDEALHLCNATLVEPQDGDREDDQHKANHERRQGVLKALEPTCAGTRPHRARCLLDSSDDIIRRAGPLPRRLVLVDRQDGRKPALILETWCWDQGRCEHRQHKQHKQARMHGH
mmetsp:Transcript_96599/g.259737  ORF Transcript_96599/g.259737 Transcript_96599/m.259737 type:complete len:296 (-) Transcript_96599:48-935(-)